MEKKNSEEPLVAELFEDDLEEERRKMREMDDRSNGFTMLSGASVSGKPLLATTILSSGGGF